MRSCARSRVRFAARAVANPPPWRRSVVQVARSLICALQCGRILPFGSSVRYDRRRSRQFRRGAAMRILTLASAACVFAIAATCVDATTLRWANRGDMQTTDPHSQNEGLTNNINSLIYEFLTDRDKQLKIRPALAESWQRVNDTTWRVKLRSGVKFHDGTPFTADDVVFSYERARADTSQLRVYSTRAGIPKKIDDLTV